MSLTLTQKHTVAYMVLLAFLCLTMVGLRYCGRDKNLSGGVESRHAPLEQRQAEKAVLANPASRSERLEPLSGSSAPPAQFISEPIKFGPSDYVPTLEFVGLPMNAKGGYDRPEEPNKLRVTLYTADGQVWLAQWIPRDPTPEPSCEVTP